MVYCRSVLGLNHDARNRSKQRASWSAGQGAFLLCGSGVLDPLCPRDTQRDMSNRAEMWKVDYDGELLILWHTERVLR
jgi:hypothetical protein